MADTISGSMTNVIKTQLSQYAQMIPLHSSSWYPTGFMIALPWRIKTQRSENTSLLYVWNVTIDNSRFYDRRDQDAAKFYDRSPVADQDAAKWALLCFAISSRHLPLANKCYRFYDRRDQDAAKFYDRSPVADQDAAKFYDRRDQDAAKFYDRAPVADQDAAKFYDRSPVADQDAA